MNPVLRAAIAALTLVGTAALAACSDDGGQAPGATTSPPPASTPAPQVTVEAAWARPSMGNTVTAAYMVIHNASNQADRLVSATSSLSPKVQLHEVVQKGDSMQMRPKEGGFPVPANGMVELKPGGYHIMLLDLARPLAVGDRVDLELTFEHAGKVSVTAEVKEQATAMH